MTKCLYIDSRKADIQLYTDIQIPKSKSFLEADWKSFDVSLASSLRRRGSAVVRGVAPELQSRYAGALRCGGTEAEPKTWKEQRLRKGKG